MLTWAAYLLVVSAILSLAGRSLERAIRPHGFPTRWIWMGVLVASLALPVVLSSTTSPTITFASAASPSLQEAPHRSTPVAPAGWAGQAAVWLGAVRSVQLNALAVKAWGVSSAASAAVLLSGWWY